MRKELLEGLSEEQIEKVKSCKNAEEILAAAKNEGVELNEEQLEAVSGGGCGGGPRCPNCGSEDTEIDHSWNGYGYCHCNSCGKPFEHDFGYW